MMSDTDRDTACSLRLLEELFGAVRSAGRGTALSVLLILPTLAHAHVAASEVSGFLRGLLHPLGGMDHLLAMAAVGVWAAQGGGRAVWLVPATFVATMAVGGAIGAAGIIMPFAEHGIALSMLVLGLLIAGHIRLSLPACAAIAGLFSVFHGHVHGVEIPADASGSAYGAGFLVATALLHGAGVAVALLAHRIAYREAWS